MTKDEALKMALDYLERHAIIDGIPVRDAIKEALAQPEQEPVANIRTWHKMGEQHAELWNWCAGLESLPDGDYDVYTSPPQREWVGLTNTEFGEIYDSYGTVDGAMAAVEAKLKEKNT